MSTSYKTDLQSARAFGSGDWKKVIEIETNALSNETHKQFRYSMIGMAYENLEDIENAKKNYGLAISHDEKCIQALEGLARVYAKENNHDLAYQYVLKGLHLSTDDDYQVSKVVKYTLAIIIKLFRPSRPFSKVLKQAQDMDQSRNKWVEWALKYKEWYESNNEASSYESIH
jgi:tetratricopeptide (TPR) repeat protein